MGKKNPHPSLLTLPLPLGIFQNHLQRPLPTNHPILRQIQRRLPRIRPRQRIRARAKQAPRGVVMIVADGTRQGRPPVLIPSLQIHLSRSKRHIYRLRVVIQRRPRKRRPPVHIRLINPGTTALHQRAQCLGMASAGRPREAVPPVLVDGGSIHPLTC
jgi:hypothetical protein